MQGTSRLLLVIAAFGACSLLHAARPLPDATNLVQRMIDRSKAVAQADSTNQCTYEKRSVTSQLDEGGEALKTEEKHYTVTMVNGMPFNRLVRVKGRELTAKELEHENRREEAFRKKVTGVDVKAKKEKREAMASDDLVNRFVFKVVKREQRQGREAVLLTFAPKNPPAPEKSIPDRVLNRFTGSIWVDEEEAELLSADVKLKAPVSVGWFGAIGSLTKCHIQFDRLRLSNGAWVTRSSAVEVVGRRVFDTMRFRTTEEASGFVVKTQDG